MKIKWDACIKHLYVWNMPSAPKMLAGNDDDDNDISSSKHMSNSSASVSINLCEKKEPSTTLQYSQCLTFPGPVRDPVNTW